MDGDAAAYELFEAASLRARDVYRLMTSIVAPRPIAWVSTLDAQGQANLAPFSYFQAVCSRPPTVVLGIGWRADGRPKDTLANILARREFTISHVSHAQVADMNATSADVEPDVDEWTLTGSSPHNRLAAVPSQRVAPPRVQGAATALECRLTHAIPLGAGPTGTPSSTLVVGEVVGFVVRRDLLARDERGSLQALDPEALDSVGRMGGIAYTRTAAFSLPRPSASSPRPHPSAPGGPSSRRDRS